MPKRDRAPSVARKVARGTWEIVDLVLSCALSFFTTLYMHPMEMERSVTLVRKREEAEVDVAINTVARAIKSLDENMGTLKTLAANASVGDNAASYAKYANELRSTEAQRDHLCYLLAALRGRIDVKKLIGAVSTLSDNVGMQLDASAKINRTVLALTVNRDLDDAWEPVTKSTVDSACLAYRNEDPVDVNRLGTSLV